MKNLKRNTKLNVKDLLKPSWMIPVSSMMLVMGIMLSLSWMTKEKRTSRFDLLAPEQRVRIAAGSLDLSEEYENLRLEVETLRKENTKFQNAIVEKSDRTKLLNSSLQKTKMFAGLTEVEGPGICITLTDYEGKDKNSPLLENYVIHDGDILRVVNELWNAGAEAISVNGHRIVAGTHFRCVGSVILIKNAKIASPFLIQAVGDAQTLSGAIKLPGGIVDEIKKLGHPDMVELYDVEKMRLKAYSGSTNHKYLTVPEVKS